MSPVGESSRESRDCLAPGKVKNKVKSKEKESNKLFDSNRLTDIQIYLELSQTTAYSCLGINFEHRLVIGTNEKPVLRKR